MANFTDEDDALLAELGAEVEVKREASRTPLEERIIAGFEDIQRFVEQHGRPPQQGEDRDIFERLYALRLDRLRGQVDFRALLVSFDRQGLLAEAGVTGRDSVDGLDDDALLAELGIDAECEDNITDLKHVRSAADKRAAEDIAERDRCKDFERFRPLFETVKHQLDAGIRLTRLFVKDAGLLKADISEGQFFILGGQTAFVAEVGEDFRAPNGESDARLRVIYSNGTESNLLRRSLQRALYKDEAGRRITEPNAGPLFSDVAEKDDQNSGTIYVLRSNSKQPDIAAQRDVLHKIGVTSGDVRRRLTNARLDPTYLMADVEVVRTYELFNINRSKLENLIHRIFSSARLQLAIKDRFGQAIVPREWFLVPLFVIDEAVRRIQDGSITQFRYDPSIAALVQAGLGNH
ncbi:GIY-YIG nuclease family protein [Lichenibacterium ramalinae]|uniref:GIY-YIG nuclease family protein n=1 Tax=Lichenibacterium ramalinae TaxID=2316527 RepID=A0A4Q2RI46_9HYPH|nr:GIY-YIG nuclease family protein [Lichenibacterium ramalinae]RYB05778.1 GIY-YIG nuclease family protein [Lichenibacterium ramalinae]